jgi:hypothetical protein
VAKGLFFFFMICREKQIHDGSVSLVELEDYGPGRAEFHRLPPRQPQSVEDRQQILGIYDADSLGQGSLGFGMGDEPGTNRNTSFLKAQLGFFNRNFEAGMVVHLARQLARLSIAKGCGGCLTRRWMRQCFEAEQFTNPFSHAR